ncbi:hypothetical protein CEUSTIGMA_g9586.t1 [Chlamydomonas eustigma]|uniref:CRAL-TRIO domain-containing protein n=1 Tax=Chlamydomonas eustigma TaxID=1157962 RepID=A0A250XGF4_9CHLO|nr:hypothetical protein CEUSTIGMA_g9586.t1 [Chlamydomonas eustigma]|eukprot:GAX82158.1 hypothetical protein CEUSTIGMA_g9586.t1 [Chlamydomonas eustigma]
MGDVLTPDQLGLVAKLKEAVSGVVQAHDSLKVFCNEHTYVRYLRARQWNLQKATKMLNDTLQWRLEYKPHLLRWDDVKVEANSGKHFLYPAPDKQGRPIVMMRPRLEDTKTHETQIKFLVYDLEMASAIADKTGVGKMCWILDFGGYSLSNAPPIKVSLHCNNILMNHYPERLGLAICYHSPTLFSLTWRAVSPFIDPVTKQKIIFVDKGPKEQKEMGDRFNMEEMEEAIGGGVKRFVYNKDDYEKLCRKFDEETEASLKAAKEGNTVEAGKVSAGQGGVTQVTVTAI